jgi:hypothetical protein
MKQFFFVTFVVLDTQIEKPLSNGSCSAEISAKAVYVPGAPMLPKKE